MLDGVYRHTDGGPDFVEVPAPTDEVLLALIDNKSIGRLMKLPTRRGVLIEEQRSTDLADRDADSDDARTLIRPLQAAACSYRIALGPRAGQCVQVQGVIPRDAAFVPDLCANVQGLSLRAAVHCGADERKRLEQLCRYISRRRWPMSGCGAMAPGRLSSS